MIGRAQGTAGVQTIVALRLQWKAIGWQIALLTLVMLPVYFLSSRFLTSGVALSQQIIASALVLWPIVLWLFFSHIPNSRQSRPIPGLVLVFIITFLGARGLVLPFVDRFLQPDLWLPGAHSVTRLIGYMLTVGLAQECTRYFVVRYTVWGSGLKTRRDAVAYCAAGAVAYALAINMDWIFSAPMSISAIALAVLESQLLQFTGAMTLAFGVSEVRLGHAQPIMLALATISGAFQVSLLITARAGLANATFAQPVSIARSLNGSLLTLMGALVFIGFAALLFWRAERPTPNIAETGIETGVR